MEADAPTLTEALSHTSWDVVWIAALAAAGALYAVGLRSARRSHPKPPSPSRAVAFYAGLALLAVALLSPLEYYGNQLLWVNFTGFLVITMLAPPLLLLGAPLTLAFMTSGPVARRRLRRFYRGQPMRTLAFPICSWLTFAVVTYLWQFSALTDQAASNDVVRDLQQATLLCVGLLFWYPALAVDPVPWRMAFPLRVLYVLVEMVHKGLFGGMFLSMSSPVHNGFASGLPAWGPDPMTDQRMAILILWIGGNLVFVAALIALAIGWSRYEARNSHRTDWHLRLRHEAESRRRAALEKVFTKGV